MLIRQIKANVQLNYFLVYLLKTNTLNCSCTPGEFFEFTRQSIILLVTLSGVFFVATASYRRRRCWDEWVSECNNRILILIQVWSGVSQCYLLFIYEYLSSSTFALDTQLSSALLWFLAYSHQSIVFSSCRDTTEDSRRQWTSHNHFRIVAIKNISFPSRNILIGVTGASWNSEKIFFHFKREQFTV